MAKNEEPSDELASRRERDMEQFALKPYAFFDESVGVVDLDDKPVCIILDAERLLGICMSIEDALLLAEALICNVRNNCISTVKR